MAINSGEIVQWDLQHILNIPANKENRVFAFTKDYLYGKWKECGDTFEVLQINNEMILVDGHHRQHALRTGRLTHLPKTFSVWLRDADSFDDVRTRQNSHMEPKRAPSSRQKASIVDKRLGLSDFESPLAKRIGLTAVKQLGYKDKDALLNGKTEFLEEIKIIESWNLAFETARYPQGILAAIIKTVRMDSEAAKRFWTIYSNKQTGTKAVNQLMNEIEMGGLGEAFNSKIYSIAVNNFDLWNS